MIGLALLAVAIFAYRFGIAMERARVRDITLESRAQVEPRLPRERVSCGGDVGYDHCGDPMCVDCNRPAL